MGTVQDQPHSPQAQRPWKRVLAELYIPARSVHHPRGLTQLRRGHSVHGLRQHPFNLEFNIIRELGALGVKEFDAVIGIGIVGSTDDDPGRGFLTAGQHGHRGRGHGSQQRDTSPCRDQSSLKRRLKHVAGHPGVLADQHMGLTFGRGEYPPGCPSELEHKVRRHRVFTHLAADAVGTKKLSPHDGWL